MLILDKIDFTTKAIKKNLKKGQYTMIKRSIRKEDITFINLMHLI